MICEKCGCGNGNHYTGCNNEENKCDATKHRRLKQIEVMAAGYYYECTECEWQGLIDSTSVDKCPECGYDIEPAEDY